MINPAHPDLRLRWVLVDSEPLSCAVQAQQLASAGLTITADEVGRLYTGMSAGDMRRAIEKRLGRPLPEVTSCARRRR